MSKITYVIPVLLLYGATLLPAQKNQSAGRLIVLSVAARTAAGDPVTDLDPADIQLREDGKPRPIAFFRFDGAGRKMAAPGPGEVANHAGPTPIVLLLDRWNDRLMTNASAWIEITKALEHMETVEQIYIYFISPKGQLFAVHPLPPPGSDLRAPIQPSPGELRTVLDQAVRGLSGVRDIDAYDPVARGNSTLPIFANLGSEMSGMLGRKSLIWVTYGFPLQLIIQGQNIDFTPSVQMLGAEFARSGTAIYSVQETEQGPGADPTSESLGTMRVFAEASGGRTYASGNSDVAIADSRADGRGAYRIAYYSPSRAGDHKEHKIRIETKRKDMRLTTLQNYLDVPSPDPAELEAATLNSAAHSPFDAPDIGLRASASTDASRSTAHVKVRIDPADVFLAHEGDRYHGQLDLVLDAYSNRAFVGVADHPVEKIDLSQDQLNQAMKDGIVLQQDVRLPANVDAIRAVAYDPSLQAAGSVVVPLK